MVRNLWALQAHADTTPLELSAPPPPVFLTSKSNDSLTLLDAELSASGGAIRVTDSEDILHSRSQTTRTSASQRLAPPSTTLPVC